jgi:hypothetical protein
VIGEREAAHDDRRRSAARVDAVKGDLVEPRALTAQGMTDAIGQSLEHGCSSGANPRVCGRRRVQESPAFDTLFCIDRK